MDLSTLGNVLMGLGLLSALVAIAAQWLASKEDVPAGQRERFANIGSMATFGVLGFVTLSLGVLLSGFLSENFRLMYVAENHSTDVSRLAWLYKISGLWAGREGSLLFWEWILACFVAYIAWKRTGEDDRLSTAGLAVANFIQVFFLVALFIETNNPFKVTPADWLDPATGQLVVARAMVPLLQHWAMIAHPPTLFVGYAGLSIPFAFAVAAILLKDGSKAWVQMVDRITVFAWLFMGIGIGLGAIWAYVVLGWGGYWAWDPVENASLLPWLTGVGLLHSFTVYRRREAFKGWSVVMATVTFVVVLLGTFITRSGILQDVSVHSFERDPVSLVWFLAMMGVSLLLGIGGLWLRWDVFKAHDEFESLVSKESSYYFNNVLMLLATIVIVGLTLSPAFGGKAFGPAAYDAIGRPIGILYVLIMAVCPILSWGKTDGATFWQRAKWPLGSALVLGGALNVLWWLQLAPNAGRNPAVATAPALLAFYSVVGMFAAALAITLPAYLFIDGARKRSGARGESFGGALGNIMTKARTTSGGYITHIGVGIILIGLIGSTMYVVDVKTTFPDKAGQWFEAGGYRFTYKGLEVTQRRNGDEVTAAVLDVSDGGKAVDRLHPNILYHAFQQQTTRNVAIMYQPLRDVFVIFESVDDKHNVSVNVKINPLISWAWVGFLLTIVGTSLAVWPKRPASAESGAVRRNKAA